MVENTIDGDFRRFREDGDPEAMARVFDAVAPRLLLLAHHLMGETGHAEDLVQTVFLQAIEDAARFDGSRPVVPWLVGILSHRATDLRRRESYRKSDVLEADSSAGDAADPGDLAAGRELAERASEAIEGLPPRNREVLVLRLVHGLEPTQIAHALGRAPGTVRMQLKRGLERLREQLPRELALSAIAVFEPGRGLGPVRAAVVGRAMEVGPMLGAGTATAASTAAVGSAIGGLLTMKVQLLLAAVGITLASLFWLAPPTGPVDGAALAVAPDTDRALLTAAPVPERARLDAARSPAEGADASQPVDPSAPGTLFVRLRRARDGTPAENVGLYLRPADRTALGIERTTDHVGVAAFEGLQPGGWRLHLANASAGLRRIDVLAGRDEWIEVALPAGLEVDGVVRDLLGNPVPGATVQRLNQDHHDYLQHVAAADSAGRFHLLDVEPGTELGARAAGWQPSDPGACVVHADRPGHATVELLLGARGHSVAGTVLEPNGEPSPRALVAITVDEDARETVEGPQAAARRDGSDRPWDTEAFFLRADEHGRFRSDEVPRGRTVVLARPVNSDGGLVGWTSGEVTAGAHSTLDVVLTHGATVFGRIVDTSGRPVRGLRVRAEWEGTPELGQTEDDLGPLLADRATFTDSDGMYALVGLLPGDYDLDVSLGQVDVGEEIELAPGESRRWDPVLADWTHLDVRLFDSDGEPLVDWRVGFSTHAGEVRSADFVPNATDVTGLARIRGLEIRPYQLSVHAPTEVDGRNVYHSIPVAVRSGIEPGSRELEIRLARDEMPTASLTARWVDDAGMPLAGKRVHLRREGWSSPSTLVTGEDGEIRTPDLAPGSYSLLARTDGYPRGSSLGEFRLARGERLDAGTLSLASPGRLLVEARTASGAPLTRARVRVSPVDPANGDARWVRPERDGSYRPVHLWAGSFEVTAELEGHAPTARRVSMVNGQDTRVVLELGAGVRQSLEIHFPSEAPPSSRGADEGRVDVFVLDASGRLVIDDRRDGPLRPDGTFTVDLHLDPGVYSVRVADHRRGLQEHARAELEFEVGHEEAAPLRVVLE